jgi:hypothetical protein
VLEDGKSRHEPCRQRRLTRPVLVDRAEPLLEERPAIARASFTSAWFMSMIASSRERKRSACPLSRRSFGRIAPSDAPEGITRSDSTKSRKRKLQAFEASHSKSLQSHMPLHQAKSTQPQSLGTFFTVD